MKKLMIFLAASCFHNILHSMETVVVPASPGTDHQREALRSSLDLASQAKLSKSSDELYSFFAAAKPIVVKLKSHEKGDEQVHIAYAVLLRKQETGQISLKLIIVHSERSQLIYKTEFDEALVSLKRYIKSNVRMDSWEEVVNFSRALLLRSDDPVWACLIIDSLFALYRANGFTRLMVAVEVNEKHRLDDWIRAYLQVSKDNPDTNVRAANTTALISAVSGPDDQGDSETDTVCQLVNIGKASVDLSNDDGSTPLIVAASHNHVKAMEFLLKKGALVDARDLKGHTALNIAASSECVEAVACLLKHNANTEIASTDTEFTPLLTAIHRGNARIVQLLLEAQANPTVMANANNTALMFAITNLGSLVESPLGSEEKEREDARQIILYLLNDPRVDSKVILPGGANALKLASLYKLQEIVGLLQAQESSNKTLQQQDKK